MSNLPLLVVAAAAAATLQCASAARAVYAIGGASLSGGSITGAVANIDVRNGNTSWSLGFDIPNGDSFCAGAFTTLPSGQAVFYAVSETNVMSFDAATGDGLTSVTPNIPYDLEVAGWDDASSLLWGVGSSPDGSGNFDIVTVDPVTGHVDVVMANIPFDELGPCEGASVPTLRGAGAASAAAAAGAFYFATDDAAGNDEVVRFSLADKAFSKPMVYKPGGDVWSVSAWYPVPAAGEDGGLVAASADAILQGAVADQALVMASPNNSLITELISMDPATGRMVHLANLDARYSAQQASFVFEPSTGMAYAVLEGPGSLVTYSIAAINLTHSPPNITYAHIPDNADAQYGILQPAVVA